MRLMEGLTARTIAGEHLLVPTGQAAGKFRGIITLNSSGVYLAEKLKQDVTREDLIDALLEKYEVDRETAEQDVDRFLDKLRNNHLLLE